MNNPDEAITKAAEALARRIAFSDCLDADMGGYGWDSDNPDHVAHFLPTATRRAAEQARIVLNAAAPLIAAQALREAADRWQQGEWANAPRRADRIQERIANGQHVGDWLRAQAENQENTK